MQNGTTGAYVRFYYDFGAQTVELSTCQPCDEPGKAMCPSSPFLSVSRYSFILNDCKFRGALSVAVCRVVTFLKHRFEPRHRVRSRQDDHGLFCIHITA